MRRPIKKKNQVIPDRVYGSLKLAKFINYVMLDGKKNTATTVVYGALDRIKDKSDKKNPLEVFDAAMKNAGPTVEVRSRRVGGANYQVPREVSADRRNTLAMRWILTAARSGKGTPMYIKLADELMAASNNEGEAVKKKENTHKMAEANKAFAHFAW